MCLAAHRWIESLYERWVYSRVFEDLTFHFDKTTHRTIDLGRLIVGMKRACRRFNGTGLMPVPA